MDCGHVPLSWTLINNDNLAKPSLSPKLRAHSSCSFQLNPNSKPSVGPGGGVNGAGAQSG